MISFTLVTVVRKEAVENAKNGKNLKTNLA